MGFSTKIFGKSGNKYIFEDTPLNLSFIEERIVAMQYPAEGLEAMYRNPRWMVEKLLLSKFGGKFMVVNATERPYALPGHPHVLNVPWRDHLPYPFRLLLALAISLVAFFNADPANALVVNCMGGKGRTGTLVSSVLYLSGRASNVTAANAFFTQKRGVGVTQQAQLRYLGYLEKYALEGREALNLRRKKLESISVPAAAAEALRGRTLSFSLSDLQRSKWSAEFALSGAELPTQPGADGWVALPFEQGKSDFPEDFVLHVYQKRFFINFLVLRLSFCSLFVEGRAVFAAGDFDSFRLGVPGLQLRFDFAEGGAGPSSAEGLDELEAGLRALRPKD